MAVLLTLVPSRQAEMLCVSTAKPRVYTVLRVSLCASHLLNPSHQLPRPYVTKGASQRRLGALRSVHSK